MKSSPLTAQLTRLPSTPWLQEVGILIGSYNDKRPPAFVDAINAGGDDHAVNDDFRATATSLMRFNYDGVTATPWLSRLEKNRPVERRCLSRIY